MIKYILPLLFLCLISCRQDEPLGSERESPKTIVLKERPADNPWEPYRINTDSLSLIRARQRAAMEMKDYLGYSFKFTQLPIVDTLNLGCPIIDIVSFEENYPSYFTYWQTAVSEGASFSFSSFSDYGSKSGFSEILANSESIRYSGFNLAQKMAFVNVFGERLTDDSKSTFGELNIIYQDSCYRMAYGSFINQTIIKDYLAGDFLRELHADNPYKFFTQNGGMVAVNYCSGWRATAIYNALTHIDSSDEANETYLTSEINTSFNSEANPNGSSLIIGSNIGGTSNKFCSILVSVKTLGGEGNNEFSAPQELSEASIDLSDWQTSLYNRSRPVISVFNQNGLVSLTEFIIEDNLKELYSTFINGQEPHYKDLIEPFVLINQIWGNKSYPEAYELYLTTRFGGNIFLGRLLGDSENSSAWLKKCIETITKVFDIRVERQVWNSRANSDTSYFQTGYYSNLFTHPEYYKKFSYNGILYMIDEVDKKGLSILDNPRVIEEYGLTEFVATLKPATISYSQMIDEGYKLNAL